MRALVLALFAISFFSEQSLASPKYKYIVTGAEFGEINVRSEPSARSTILFKLRNGFEILDYSDAENVDWLRICLNRPCSQSNMWVRRSLLTLVAVDEPLAVPPANSPSEPSTVPPQPPRPRPISGDVGLEPSTTTVRSVRVLKDGSQMVNFDDGPFGIVMGSNPTKYGCVSNEKDPGNYFCNNVPKPHPDFGAVVAIYAEDTGICSIVAMKKGGSLYNPSNIMSDIDRLSKQIGESYGKGVKIDRSSMGQSDPDLLPLEFMSGMRSYGYSWNSIVGSSMKNGVNEIAIFYTPNKDLTATIAISYRFDNYKNCETSINRRKGSSF